LGCSGKGRTDDGASGSDCCDCEGAGADFCALSGGEEDAKKSVSVKLMILWRMNSHSSSIDAIEHSPLPSRHGSNERCVKHSGQTAK
jgi:hypothetical protein